MVTYYIHHRPWELVLDQVRAPCDRDWSQLLACIYGQLRRPEGYENCREGKGYVPCGMLSGFDELSRIKVGDRWGIIDRSFGSEHAVMHGMWEPEYESEDEND